MLGYRPEFICLVVIYWVLHCPHHVGVGLAWVVGLLQDFVEDSVWGAHAMALAFVTYLCLHSYQRLRNYSLQQQTMWIFIFVGVHQLFVNWFQGLDKYETPFHYMISSAILTGIIWPCLIILMGKLQRYYRIF
jgi:rod shape-determining protein MreD